MHRQMKLKINFCQLFLFSVGLLSFLHTAIKIYIVSKAPALLSVINVLQYIDYVLILLCVQLRKFKPYELFIYITLIILSLFITFASGELIFLSAILVIFAAREREYKRICKSLLYGTFAAFLLGVFLYILGISNSGLSRRGAIALGFGHPNSCASVIVSLVFLFYSIRDGKLKKKEWAFVIAAIAVNAIALDSRTAALLLMLTPILSGILPQLFRKKRKILMVFLCCVPFVLFAAVYYTSVNYTPTSNFYQALAAWTSGRPILNQYNLQTIGITWLGQKIFIDRTALQGFNTVDCSYLLVLLQCGIVGTAILLISYSAVIYKMIKTKQYRLLAATLLLLLNGVMENVLLDISTSFILIYLVDSNGKYVDKIPIAKEEKNDS